MKRIFAIAVFALLTFTHNAFAWGEFGHKAIVEIAKRHMTEKAKQNIAKYFSLCGRLYCPLLDPA